MKQKKIKFYISHDHYVHTGVIRRSFKIWRKFFDALFKVCFHTGLALIKFIKKIFYIIKNDIYKTKQTFPKRIHALFKSRVGYTVASFIILCSAAWIGISSLHLVAKGIDLKNRIIHTATLGNSYLAKAKTDLSGQNIENAQTSFTRAFQTFSKGKEDIAKSGQLLNSLLSVLPQKQTADNLLEAAALVSSAGQDFVLLDSNIKNLNIGPNGVTSSHLTTAENLESISEILESASSKINSAAKLVSDSNLNVLPKQNQENFISLSNELQNANIALQNFKSIFSLFKDILLGQKNVLFLLENNNELRAGGGFMGTFAAIKLKNGTIESLKVSSIYDLDGQLLNIIKPPQPLLNTGDRFYLRNSNWFASYPESAKKVSDFYEMEAGQTPDLILTMTPNFIIDLLKITGPVSFPKYGLTLTPENFVEQTQAATTITDNLPTNSPKQMLADLFPILLQRLSNLKPELWPQIILALQTQLTQKQIVLFSRDPQIQKQLELFHWTGELEKTDRDFLAVVSSNLGGTKTDLNIDQKISLVTSVANDGTVTNQLSITRTNKMPKLAAAENVSYLRIFAPLGSKLTSNLGFDIKTIDFPTNLKYKIDDDVLAWEKNSVTENLTQTRIGQEAGKTFFANWVELAPGETKTVVLTYELPFKLQNVDRYSLLLQKQIGSLPGQFNWAINFPARRIEWKNFNTNELNTGNLKSDILLDKDYFFGLVFSKQ
jgi:hypothetical protein